MNRARPNGWLTPTANQLLQTHLNMAQDIRKLLPVSDWTLEVNRFAFMRMEDGSICGADSQNGRLRNFKSAEEFVCAQQHGRCVCCGGRIDHYHHIMPRHKSGSDSPENLAGLCKECHANVHTGKLSLAKLGQAKKYAALSILNQVIPYIYDGLVAMFGENHVHVCDGWQAAEQRKRLGFGKTHDADAVCIASVGNGSAPMHIPQPFEVKQFRRHNLANIHSQRERTYKLYGVTVAKNRNPRFEQQGDSLEDFLASLPAAWRQDVCRQLTVIPSKGHCNTKGRYLPGNLFFYEGRRHVLSGQRSNGKYYRAVGMGDKNFPSKDCRVVHAGGLVYI